MYLEEQSGDKEPIKHNHENKKQIKAEIFNETAKDRARKEAVASAFKDIWPGYDSAVEKHDDYSRRRSPVRVEPNIFEFEAVSIKFDYYQRVINICKSIQKLSTERQCHLIAEMGMVAFDAMKRQWWFSLPKAAKTIEALRAIDDGDYSFGKKYRDWKYLSPDGTYQGFIESRIMGLAGRIANSHRPATSAYGDMRDYIIVIMTCAGVTDDQAIIMIEDMVSKA